MSPAPRVVRESDGRMVLLELPGLVACQLAGNGRADFVPAILEAWRRAATPDRPVALFFEVGGLTGYETGLRTGLTQAFVADTAAVKMIHTFSRSKLVSAGIAVASLMVQKVKAYARREDFDAALSAELSERGGTAIGSDRLFE